MAVVGLSIGGTREFVAASDKGPDKTIWVLGTLDAYTWAYLNDNLAEFEVEISEDETVVPKTRMKIHASAIEACRYGLRGWKNFKDEKGGEIPFETEKIQLTDGRVYQVVKSGVLGRIPIDVIMEISNKLREVNLVTEEEEKNSEGA